MKKLMVGLIVIGVVIAAFGTATVVNAQSGTPQPYYGQNGGGRYGNRTGAGLQGENEAVHDLMMEAWSAELGISVDELNTRLDAGETMSQIALSSGLSFEEFWTLKSAVHSSVAEQALEQGLITQAQADWMQQAAQRQAGGYGRGMGAGMNGDARGLGANCPNLQ